MSPVFQETLRQYRWPLEERGGSCFAEVMKIVYVYITHCKSLQEDQKVIADTLFDWARERGAIDFAHWFFPLRGSLA